MKKILAIIILGLGLSGCAGMELSSVSVGVSNGHYGHHYYPSYYYAHPTVVYRQRVIVQRPVIVQHNHTVVRPQNNQHDRRDRRDRRHDRKRH